jgi:hypothetical protein
MDRAAAQRVALLALRLDKAEEAQVAIRSNTVQEFARRDQRSAEMTNNYKALNTFVTDVRGGLADLSSKLIATDKKVAGLNDMSDMVREMFVDMRARRDREERATKGSADSMETSGDV